MLILLMHTFFSFLQEFKLNPGAKIFSPSFPNKRSPTPPAIPTGANVACIPESYQAVPVATPQPEVEISPYAPRSLPVKFVPYGGNDVQHPPPVSLNEIYNLNIFRDDCFEPFI